MVFELIRMARISLINGGELTMAFSSIPILWGLLLLLLFQALQILTARPLLHFLHKHHHPHHHHCDGMTLDNESMTGEDQPS